ncbi:MAG: ribosome-binding factor A, partial [Acidobacteria bacterium]|nr:ribosome-binding factor A [Acidobacteriota bacterium]
RRQLAVELNLRHAPQLNFVRDTVEERAARVDDLLREISRDTPPEEGAASEEEGDTATMSDERGAMN